MTRQSLHPDVLTFLTREAAARRSTCREVYCGDVVRQPVDANGCNWRLSRVEGTNCAECLADIVPIINDLQARFEIGFDTGASRAVDLSDLLSADGPADAPVASSNDSSLPPSRPAMDRADLTPDAIPTAGYPLIVIGTSAGGVAALLRLAEQLPADFPAAILVTLHLGQFDGRLPSLMERRSKLSVRYAEHEQRIEKGRVFVAPPDRHLLVDGVVLRLSRGAKENFARPAIDPMFRSAALTWVGPLVGVVLTGTLDDGAAGLRLLKQRGGIAVVQDPDDADAPSMPRAALAATPVDHVVRLDELPALLNQLAEGVPMRENPKPTAAEEAELALTMGDGDPFEILPRIGKPSNLTCPECGGSLWRLDQGTPRRFRCHTGHSYTLRALELAQSDAAGMSMWSTLRLLNEKHLLLRELADSYAAEANQCAADSTMRLADKVDWTAVQLRSLLEDLPSSVEGSLPTIPTA